jgi:tetratricopeptide (TPR) repeat protein
MDFPSISAGKNANEATPSMDAAEFPPPPGLLNSLSAPEIPGYRILKQIGAGGNGLVYAAIQETLGRKVALKILNSMAALQPGARERFRTEALAAGPTDVEALHRLGQFLHNLATLRRRANRLSEADAYYRDAIAAHEAGMKVEAPDVLRRVMLSDSWIGRGLVAWAEKRFPEAEAAYQRAADTLSAALTGFPHQIDAGLALGILHINWGLLAQDEGNLDLTLTRFDRAVAILDEIHQREPKLARIQRPLYNVYGARGAFQAA